MDDNDDGYLRGGGGSSIASSTAKVRRRRKRRRKLLLLLFDKNNDDEKLIKEEEEGDNYFDFDFKVNNNKREIVKEESNSLKDDKEMIKVSSEHDENSNHINLFHHHHQQQQQQQHQNIKDTSRIVGGIDTRANKYKFFTLLMQSDEEGIIWRSLSCGASLIDACWVVTAAHCVHDSNFDVVRNLGVYVNAWKPYDQNEGHPKHVTKVRTIHYQTDKYVPSSKDQRYDIALLRLETCANSDYFIPVDMLPPPPLPSDTDNSDESNDNDDSRFLTVIGLGNTHESGRNPMTRVLQEVRVKHIPNKLCNEYYNNNNKKNPTKKTRGGYYRIYDDMMCAGYEQGTKDACQGDSGGPLLQFDIDDIPHQVGVVSWGVGCARYKRPGVYSATQYSITWNWMKHLVCNDQNTIGLKLCDGNGIQQYVDIEDIIQGVAPPKATATATSTSTTTNCTNNGRGVFKPNTSANEELRFRCNDMAPNNFPGHHYCTYYDVNLDTTAYEYCPQSCNPTCFLKQ